MIAASLRVVSSGGGRVKRPPNKRSRMPISLKFLTLMFNPLKNLEGILCRIRFSNFQRIEPMITCHVRYVIDPYQISAFESYSRQWIEVVTRMGESITATFYPPKAPTISPTACSASPAWPTTKTIEGKPIRIRSVLN